MKNNYEGYYIVRCNNAGVLAGEIVSREGQEVKMKNVRRIWYWSGACTLFELAKDGTKEPNECKFTVTIDEIELLEAIEIIKCTEEAEKSIKGVKEWKY